MDRDLCSGEYSQSPAALPADAPECTACPDPEKCDDDCGEAYRATSPRTGRQIGLTISDGKIEIPPDWMTSAGGSATKASRAPVCTRIVEGPRGIAGPIPAYCGRSLPCPDHDPRAPNALPVNELGVDEAADPRAPSEDERREYVLTEIVEDARRAEAGDDPICDRCKNEIANPRLRMYRCAECGLPFHLRCIQAHFEDHRAPSEGEGSYKQGWDAHAAIQLVGNPVVYAALYPGLVVIGREHGYAIALHGSLRKDMDIIAIPWSDEARPADALVATVLDRIKGARILGEPAGKPHGRRVWTILLANGSYIDFGVMPLAARLRSTRETETVGCSCPQDAYTKVVWHMPDCPALPTPAAQEETDG